MNERSDERRNGEKSGEQVDMSAEHETNTDTFEMLWDCKFCRTPKLLGLTHRYCPVCGAPQNAEARYFPSDEEKVAVKNHRYFGRDLVCEHCNAFNSRKSQHCRDCGAPLQNSKEVPVQDEATATRGLASQQEAPQKAAQHARSRSRIATLLLLGLGAICVALVVFFFWKREATFEVVGHQWQRTIDIERFGPVRESAWCDQLPATARELGRHREARSHEQVRDGETCSTRRIDQGDGTFKEIKHCEPRYKSREIYDYRCDYEVNKWTKARSAERSGQSLAVKPEWPVLSLTAACTRVGCERQGKKHEDYVLQLRAPDGSLQTCSIPETRWANAALGQSYMGSVRVIGGGLDCDSLQAR